MWGADPRVLSIVNRDSADEAEEPALSAQVALMSESSDSSSVFGFLHACRRTKHIPTTSTPAPSTTPPPSAEPDAKAATAAAFSRRRTMDKYEGGALGGNGGSGGEDGGGA